MKKIIVTISVLLIISVAFAQEVIDDETKQEFKNVKKIQSKLSEETKIEIRKPDNSSLLLRKETEKVPYAKLSIMKILKKSNKALY